MGIGFQMGQILWDFISQCEILFHSVRYGMYVHAIPKKCYFTQFERRFSVSVTVWQEFQDISVADTAFWTMFQI